MEYCLIQYFRMSHLILASSIVITYNIIYLFSQASHKMLAIKQRVIEFSVGRTEGSQFSVKKFHIHWKMIVVYRRKDINLLNVFLNTIGNEKNSRACVEEMGSLSGK